MTTKLPNPGGRPRNAVVAGATGLVGGRCLERLLASPTYDEVVVLARRPLGRGHPRLRVVLADFAKLDELTPPSVSAAFVALGTTIKKAGSEAAFRAVDHDAVIAFARWAREGGADRLVAVSSVGADPGARNLYLRVKGETEEALAEIGFPRLVLVRPSMLLGPRDESRPGEALGRAVLPLLAPVLAGPLRRYRAIAADDAAAAMLAAAADDTAGRFVWEYDEIMAAAHPPK